MFSRYYVQKLQGQDTINKSSGDVLATELEGSRGLFLDARNASGLGAEASEVGVGRQPSVADRSGGGYSKIKNETKQQIREKINAGFGGVSGSGALFNSFSFHKVFRS